MTIVEKVGFAIEEAFHGTSAVPYDYPKIGIGNKICAAMAKAAIAVVLRDLEKYADARPHDYMDGGIRNYASENGIDL